MYELNYSNTITRATAKLRTAAEGGIHGNTSEPNSLR
jgi:hypothetical protein